jgi:sulfite exporter TauE/SafE
LSAVNRNSTPLWTSVFTAGGYGDIAGFAAFGAVVQTVGTEAHRVLAFADGAILLAGAVVLWFFALRTDHRSGHNASQQTLQTLPERIPCSKAPQKTCVVSATTSSPRLPRRRPFFDPTWSAC